MNRPDWYLETHPTDEHIIRKYANEPDAHGTEQDKYVAYVVAKMAIDKARKNKGSIK